MEGMTFVYCDCGNLMDQGCNGNPRCDICDPPCLCCSDGNGPSIFDEDEDDEEETVEYDVSELFS